MIGLWWAVAWAAPATVRGEVVPQVVVLPGPSGAEVADLDAVDGWATVVLRDRSGWRLYAFDGTGVKRTATWPIRVDPTAVARVGASGEVVVGVPGGEVVQRLTDPPVDVALPPGRTLVGLGRVDDVDPSGVARTVVADGLVAWTVAAGGTVGAPAIDGRPLAEGCTDPRVDVAQRAGQPWAVVACAGPPRVAWVVDGLLVHAPIDGVEGPAPVGVAAVGDLDPVAASWTDRTLTLTAIDEGVGAPWRWTRRWVPAGPAVRWPVPDRSAGTTAPRVQVTVDLRGLDVVDEVVVVGTTAYVAGQGRGPQGPQATLLVATYRPRSVPDVP